MKLWKFILAALAFLMVCTTFTNCSKSDDNGGLSRSIVGTWVAAAPQEIITMRFDSDGRFSERYQSDYGDDQTSRGEYVYDGYSLELYYADGNGETDFVYVEWIDNNHIILWGIEFTRR